MLQIYNYKIINILERLMKRKALNYKILFLTEILQLLNKCLGLNPVICTYNLR